MKSLRNLTFALALCVSAPWLGAQSNAAVGDSESKDMTAQVQALVTDGETGEVIPDINLTFTTIDVPGAQGTIIYGINAAGDVVGIYGDTFFIPPRAFLLSGGRFTYLDYPGAYGTVASGINDSSVIVGQAEFENGTAEVGFKYNRPTFTSIRDGNNSATICLGLNNAGWVVGGDGTVDATKGFELRNGRFGTIKFPGTYVYGYATGINNLEEVVGYTTGGLYIDAYRYGKGEFEKIDFPGSTQTEAWGINDAGVIVGWYAGTGANDYGFAMRNGRFISFSYPGAVITAAYRINAYGQIVGLYSLGDGLTHGFVTSPLTPADFPPDE